ncbi:MAG: hypothetical protein ACR2OA_20120 [Rubripirellula sp.]
MTTQKSPHRLRRRFALAVALACSASVMTGQASEPNEFDGFSQIIPSAQSGQRSVNVQQQSPRRLPSITGDSATFSEATLTEPHSETKFDGGAWKTKMVFERLELRAASGTNDRLSSGVLQKCSGESQSGVPTLSGGVTTVSNPDSIGEVRWLRSSSASVCARRARTLIDRGTIEYGSGAWLSAEATVWEAFRCAAEGIDLQERELAKAQLGIRRQSATGRLQFARTAIREARDFSGVYGNADGHVISRMAISHSTDVLDVMSCDTLTGSDAADRYLDAARVALAGIASRSAEAAQGMDLLAAIYLKQNDTTKLHGATALCLRRAALQGQPDNASLASRLGMHLLDVGLMEEARWALSHSLSIEDDGATTQAYIAVLQQTGRQLEAQKIIASLQPAPQSIVRSERVPAITELSPQDFVAISKPVMPATAPRRSQVTPASVRTGGTSQGQTDAGRDDLRSDPAFVPQYGQQTESASKPNIFKRFAESVKNIW